VLDKVLSYDIDDWRSANLSHNRLALEILEERARDGEKDAQWLLYQVQPNAENMTWLCRDADQGMARACRELGMLYYYGSDEYRKSMGIHVPADITRSCMWFHLAGLAQITEQKEMNDVDLKSALYESAEVERTANVMAAQEMAEAEQLLLNWEPGQCERDLSQHMVITEYANDPVLERLCTAADLGDFTSRNELGRIYFFGSRGVTEDVARAYMWYRLAAKVYEPPSGPMMQTICDAMTPEQRSIAIKLIKEWEVGQCEKELLQ
jgi:TPR repeat protein